MQGVTKVCFVLAIAGVLILLSSTTTHAQKDNKQPISDEAIDMALNDKRYLLRQLKCALGEAPCDPIGRRLKSLAPLVLRGSCPQCTPKETLQIKKVLGYVQRNFPKEWAKVIQQYAG